MALVARVEHPGDVFTIGLTSPGFAFLLKGWLALTGFSELAAQVLPFVAGVAGPAVVFLLGRRLGLGRLPAGVAGLLVALSPVHVQHSVAVKQYTLDLLAVSAIVWLAWRTLEAPSRRRWLTLLAVAALATMVTASVVPAAASAVAATAIPSLRGRDWRGLLGPAGYAAFVGGWWLVLRDNLTSSLRDYWAFALTDEPRDLLVAAGRVLQGLTSVRAAVLVVALLALLGAGAVLARPELRVLLWGPLVLALAASTVGVPLGTGRTDLYLYAPVALALAWTIERLLPRLDLRAAALTVLVVLALPPAVADYPDEDVRPLVSLALEGLGDDDLLLLSPGADTATALYGPGPVRIRPGPADGHRWYVDHGDARIRVLPRALDGAALDGTEVPTSRRVLVLWSHYTDRSLAFERDVDRWLADAGYREADRHPREGAHLVEYRSVAEVSR